jgi:hypothetical protein
MSNYGTCNRQDQSRVNLGQELPINPPPPIAQTVTPNPPVNVQNNMPTTTQPIAVVTTNQTLPNNQANDVTIGIGNMNIHPLQPHHTVRQHPTGAQQSDESLITSEILKTLYINELAEFRSSLRTRISSRHADLRRVGSLCDDNGDSVMRHEQPEGYGKEDGYSEPDDDDEGDDEE